MALACRWGANIDIQFIGNSAACAGYVASYMTKPESSKQQEAITRALQKLPENATMKQR